MLNGNEENEYRHRPEYMEFVGHNILWYVILQKLNNKSDLKAKKQRMKNIIFYALLVI